MNTHQSVNVKIKHEESSVIGNIDVLYSLLETNENPPMLPLREERRTDGIELVYNYTKESHHHKMFSRPYDQRGKDVIFRSNYHTSAMSYDAYLEFLEQRHKQIVRTTQGYSVEENRDYESRSIGSLQDSSDYGYSIYCMIDSSNSVLSEMTSSVSTEYHNKWKKENIDILYSILGTPPKLPLQEERRTDGVEIVHCEKGITQEAVRDEKLWKQRSLFNNDEHQRSRVDYDESENLDEGDTCYVNNRRRHDEGASSKISLQALLSNTDSSGLVDKYSQFLHDNSYSLFEEDYDMKENVKLIDQGSHESRRNFENDIHLTLDKYYFNRSEKCSEPSERVYSEGTGEVFNQHSPNNQNAKSVSKSLFTDDVDCRQVHERMYPISVNSNDLVEDLIESSTNKNLDLLLSEDDISEKRIESFQQYDSKLSSERIEADNKADSHGISNRNVLKREIDNKENCNTIDKEFTRDSLTKVPFTLKSATKNIIEVQDRKKLILASERIEIQDEIVRFDLFEPKMHFLLY